MNSITVMLVIILIITTIFSVLYTVSYRNELVKARKKIRALQTDANAALYNYKKATHRANEAIRRANAISAEAESIHVFLTQHPIEQLKLFNAENGDLILQNEEVESDYVAIHFAANKDTLRELL